MSQLGRRVTVDVDGVDRDHSTVRMLVIYFRLNSLGAESVRVDLTRRGFHVVAWFSSEVDTGFVRQLCGDCAGRLYVDEVSGAGVSRQVLFGVKGGFRVRKGIVVV